MLGVQQATMAAPKFKKKSHEEQWKVNRTILDNFEEASEALADVKTDPGGVEHLEKTKKEIAEGKSSLNDRQKLIMLADQSKFGWGTVAEYVQNELAEDSDDEKRIWKAESRAKMNRNKEKRIFGYRDRRQKPY